MSNLQYNPERLNVLIATIIRQAYREATLEFIQEDGKPYRVPVKVKRAARRWWNTDGRAWAETICPELPLPGALEVADEQPELPGVE